MTRLFVRTRTGMHGTVHGRYLNVKFVPFILWVGYGRAIPRVVWASAAAAFTGTYLLANDGAPPNIGDVWCIGAALSSAMYMVRLEDFKLIPDPAELNAVAFTTVAMCVTVATMHDAPAPCTLHNAQRTTHNASPCPCVTAHVCMCDCVVHCQVGYFDKKHSLKQWFCVQ